jgi:PAS domain S-box-containing protein
MELGQRETRLDLFDIEASLPLFQRFIEFVPDGVLGVRETGAIVFANVQAEKMFGYARDALLGRPMDILVPERFRGAHTRHRTDYFAVPHMRPMGTGLEFHGLRADGSEFEVEISLSAIQSGRGTIVLTVIRDVAESIGAKRAERLLKAEPAPPPGLEDLVAAIVADADLLASQLTDFPDLQAVVTRLRDTALQVADADADDADDLQSTSLA